MTEPEMGDAEWCDAQAEKCDRFAREWDDDASRTTNPQTAERRRGQACKERALAARYRRIAVALRSAPGGAPAERSEVYASLDREAREHWLWWINEEWDSIPREDDGAVASSHITEAARLNWLESVVRGGGAPDGERRVALARECRGQATALERGGATKPHPIPPLHGEGTGGYDTGGYAYASHHVVDLLRRVADALDPSADRTQEPTK